MFSPLWTRKKFLSEKKNLSFHITVGLQVTFPWVRYKSSNKTTISQFSYDINVFSLLFMFSFLHIAMISMSLKVPNPYHQPELKESVAIDHPSPKGI